MTNDNGKIQPKVPTERPDPAAAARDPKAGAKDRPGFDLGGKKDSSGSTAGSNMRNPIDPPVPGSTPGRG